MATAQPQTKVLSTLDVKTDKVTQKVLIDKIGRLGSPINGKDVGAEFEVTLNGKIEIREFSGVKGAYYLTKEGYSIKVDASFNPEMHKDGAKMPCICALFEAPDGRKIKYTTFKVA